MSDFEVFPNGTGKLMLRTEIQLHDLRTIVLPLCLKSEQLLRGELISLRVSLARIAQAAGVDNDLEVTSNDWATLCKKARENDRGWNDLAGRIVEALGR